MMTPAAYLNLRQRLWDAGYREDWEWSQTVKPPLTADAFASQYVWVVLNSGMKNTVAQGIADRLYPVIEAGGSAREAFGHPGKVAAIDLIWTMRECYFARMMLAADLVEFCRNLPWIGKITCWHLAKNLGADVAKPDRWLVRVAEDSGETVEALCRRLSAATGDRIATVDLVIWRACATGLLVPKARRVAA